MEPTRNNKTPNPGSRDARTLGCLCPVSPNNYGERPPYDDGWIVTLDCPIHND